jgi:hypothetical protein
MGARFFDHISLGFKMSTWTSWFCGSNDICSDNLCEVVDVGDLFVNSDNSSLEDCDLLGEFWSLGNWSGVSLDSEGFDNSSDVSNLGSEDGDSSSEDSSNVSDDARYRSWSRSGVFDRVDCSSDVSDLLGNLSDVFSDDSDLFNDLRSLGNWSGVSLDDESSDGLLVLSDGDSKDSDLLGEVINKLSHWLGEVFDWSMRR